MLILCTLWMHLSEYASVSAKCQRYWKQQEEKRRNDAKIKRQFKVPSGVMVRTFDTNFHNTNNQGSGGPWPCELQFASTVGATIAGGTWLRQAGLNWACLNLMSLGAAGTDYFNRSGNTVVNLRLQVRMLVKPGTHAKLTDDVGRILVVYDVGKDTPVAGGAAPFAITDLLNDYNDGGIGTCTVYSYKNYDNEKRFTFLRDLTVSLGPYSTVTGNPPASPLHCDVCTQPYYIYESIDLTGLKTEYTSVAADAATVTSIQSGALYIVLFGTTTINGATDTNSTWVAAGETRLDFISTFI